MSETSERNQDTAALAATVTAELKRISDEVKDVGRAAMNEAAKAAGQLGEETKKRVDDLLTKQGEVVGRLLEVEQKLAKNTDNGPTVSKSIGQQFTESDSFKRYASDGAQPATSAHMRLKSLSTKAITSLSASAGQAIAPDFRPEIDLLPRQELTIRDLMVPSRTNSNAVTYVRMLGRTNNAATTSETVKKPESTLTLEQITVPVVTIAHFIKAAKQILDDVPQLSGLIDGELRYGVKLAEETQLLKGSGVGNNLQGIYTVATTYSAPITNPNSSPNPRIEILRLAMLQVQLGCGFPATGIVLHPSDWTAIEITQDGNKNYLIGNPVGTIVNRLWGLPVVSSLSMTLDTFLVGAFRPFSVVYDREEANVVVATENEDDFVKNLVTVRGEERLASAVKRTAAFVKGDITP